MTNYTESKLLQEARLFLGQQEDLVIYRNETMTLAPVNTTEIRRVIGLVKQGQKQLALEMLEGFLRRGMVAAGLCRGSSDLIGIHKPTGRFIAIELKTLKGVVEPEQALFLKLVEDMGGFARVCRDMTDVRVALADIRGKPFVR